MLAAYKDSAPNARPSITYDLTNFTAGGPPGLAAKQPTPAPASTAPEMEKYRAEESQARNDMRNAQSMQFWRRLSIMLGIFVKNNKVLSVVKNSPAEKVGVMRDDLIVAINGIPVDQAELSRITVATGTPVELLIQRAGREMTINVKRERPSPPPQMPPPPSPSSPPPPSRY